MSTTLTTSNQEDDRRPNLAEFSAGLRELAAWVDEHPEAADEFSFSEVTILAPVNDAGSSPV